MDVEPRSSLREKKRKTKKTADKILFESFAVWRHFCAVKVRSNFQRDLGRERKKTEILINFGKTPINGRREAGDKDRSPLNVKSSLRRLGILHRNTPRDSCRHGQTGDRKREGEEEKQQAHRSLALSECR